HRRAVWFPQPALAAPASAAARRPARTGRSALAASARPGRVQPRPWARPQSLASPARVAGPALRAPRPVLLPPARWEGGRHAGAVIKGVQRRFPAVETVLWR